MVLLAFLKQLPAMVRAIDRRLHLLRKTEPPSQAAILPIFQNHRGLCSGLDSGLYVLVNIFWPTFHGWLSEFPEFQGFLDDGDVEMRTYFLSYSLLNIPEISDEHLLTICRTWHAAGISE